MSLKRVDYVLVVTRNEIMKPENYKQLMYFVNYLQERGVRFNINEQTDGPNADIVVINVYVSKKALKHYSMLYNVNITSIGHNYVPSNKIKPSLFDTPLTFNDHDMFHRRRMGGATSMERINVTNEILNDAPFSDYEDSRGLDRLIKSGVLKTAFPLHDGYSQYAAISRDDELNDRQLLLKYWANFSMWYKKQPLNLIEKYYGAEIAFYFAWLGFYNKMLIYASIIGVVCFIYSAIMLHPAISPEIGDICNSSLVLCPICLTFRSCVLKPLNQSCDISIMHFLFDNRATVAYAIFMSFWSTLFLSLWNREENVLKIRWNLQFAEYDTKIRAEYKERATAYGFSAITGDMEHHIPKTEKIKYFIITYSVCFFMLFLVLLVVLAVILLRIYLNRLMNKNPYLAKTGFWHVMCICALIQIIFIKLFGKLYGPLSVWLTSVERPRTQREFDQGVIHKRYFLGFANNYIPLFYIAFLKGRTYAPTRAHKSFLGVVEDVCQPLGCMTALCIQLLFYMLFKSLAGNVCTLVVPIIRRKIRGKIRGEKQSHRPQWERDLDLAPSDQYLLTTEFMEMIIQYGFVTFFVAAFPLAPLCALINNTLELRLDAFKFVARHRRPIPRRQSGIITWSRILRAITYMSTATNAFVLAFTSNFVARELYQYQHGTAVGYIIHSFSEYDLAEFQVASTVTHPDSFTNTLLHRNETKCFYRAERNPPDHPNKYELTNQHYYLLGVRLLGVIIFENLILLFRGIIAYVVQDVPGQVSKKLEYDQQQERVLKIKALCENINENFDKETTSTVKIRRKLPISATPAV